MLSARLFRLLGSLFSEIIPFFVYTPTRFRCARTVSGFIQNLQSLHQDNRGIKLIIGSLESKSLKCTNQFDISKFSNSPHPQNS